jgi:hypothetical protein
LLKHEKKSHEGEQHSSFRPFWEHFQANKTQLEIALHSWFVLREISSNASKARNASLQRSTADVPKGQRRSGNSSFSLTFFEPSSILEAGGPDDTFRSFAGAAQAAASESGTSRLADDPFGTST